MHNTPSIAKRSIAALAIAAVSLLSACDFASVLELDRSTRLCTTSQLGNCSTDAPGDP